MKFVQRIGALIVFFLLVGSSHGFAGECRLLQASRTFFQPWERHAAYSAKDWDRFFQRLASLGFTEVILQWSSYGDLSFYQDRQPDQRQVSLLPAFIQAAGRQGIGLWIGLHADPDWWQRLGPVAERGQYLEQRRASLQRSLPELYRQLVAADPEGTIVRGWYIADEIDDVNWQQPFTQTLLQNYLKAVSLELKQLTPNWPILVSGFVNGSMSPQAWSRLWRDVFAQTQVDTLLLQDGIGAGKMTLVSLPPYIAALKRQLEHPQRQLQMVVEVFNMAGPGGKTATESANFFRVYQQLELAAEIEGDKALTVFSAPDHLLSEDRRAQRLAGTWREYRKRCQAGSQERAPAKHDGSAL